MTASLWATLIMIAGLVMTAIGDMASQEIRDRLDHLPHAILRLASRQLDPGQRITVYLDEWLPELTYILKGAEARPITRLIAGTWYALGILTRTRRIAAHLHRPLSNPSQATTDQPTGDLEYPDLLRLRDRRLYQLDVEIRLAETDLRDVTDLLAEEVGPFGSDSSAREDILRDQAAARTRLTALHAEREALAKKDPAELITGRAISGGL